MSSTGDARGHICEALAASWSGSGKRGSRHRKGLERRAQKFALLDFVVGVGFITNLP